MLVIQARLDSKRWPRKVLADIDGIPMIDRVHKACMLSGVKPVIVAIPEGDTELWDHCRKQGFICFPYDGDRNDLIGRYLAVVKELGYDRVLRITCDCPFHFPQEISWVWLQGQLDDFTTNGWPQGRTVADGCDAEVYSRRLLEWMDYNVTDLTAREHLPKFLYENEAEISKQFTINKLNWPVNLSWVKTSIDSLADVQLMKAQRMI